MFKWLWVFVAIPCFAQMEVERIQSESIRDGDYQTPVQQASRPMGEPWKGSPPDTALSAALMVGGGILDDSVGLPILGALGYEVMPKGFLPDITDRAFIEIAMGPQFMSESDAFVFSAHLRWDFVYNEIWTFYGLGGLGGAQAGSTRGDNLRVHPRFGAGMIYRFDQMFGARLEVSHEWFTAGVHVEF